MVALNRTALVEVSGLPGAGAAGQMRGELRALFVCTSLKTGGAERQWETLIPGLRSHGIRADVLTLKAEGPVAARLRENGIVVNCPRIRQRFDLLRLRATIRDAARESLDVVVTRSIDAHIVGALIASRTGAAHVATEHTDYALLRLRAHRRLLYRLVGRYVDAAIAVTVAQLPGLEALGYRRESLMVVPSGIVPPIVSKSSAATRGALGLSASDVVFAVISALRPEKRLDVFIKAVGLAHTRDPRVRGIIVGDGPDRQRLQLLCTQNGCVHLAGERSDVGNVIAASDAVCLTSVREALPLSLLEAASLGVPLVATDVGGTSDVVRQGRTGYLIAPGSAERFSVALLALASDSSRRATFGQAAKDLQMRSFSVETMVERYAAVLWSVRERKSKRPSGRA